MFVWVNSTLAFFLILGFPVALIFAWAFEMTSEGLKKEVAYPRSSTSGTATRRITTSRVSLTLSIPPRAE